MHYYVYVYKDPSRNNEPIYVGKGSGNRYLVHLNRKRKHPFKQRIDFMRNNCVEPLIEKIEVGTNEKFAYDIEICLIRRLGRKDLGTGPLLNLSPGGENPPVHPGPLKKGHVMSEEVKAKISETLKGRAKDKDHKMKIALAMKSDSIRKQRSDWNGNAVWINNGSSETKMLKTNPIPDGFTRGRI
jgi:hypothetical protein